MAELGALRIADMDAAGITVHALSVSGPGADLVGGADGVALAREMNDVLARGVAEHPDRFAGFAHLPIAVRRPRPTSWNAPCATSAVAADGELWFTENFANEIGRMAPDGTMIGEYEIPTPASGAPRITAMSDGRLFFTQYNVGLIGEIVPQ